MNPTLSMLATGALAISALAGVRDASEAGGKIVLKVESMLMTATDYSPTK